MFTVLSMIFCHVIDDYGLQGILAQLKQKSYWRKDRQYKPLYRYDYICALIMHSFSWSFMIMLPIALKMSFNIGIDFLICIIINTVIHAITDNFKANKFRINLWTDQLIHMLQIAVTAMIFI